MFSPSPHRRLLLSFAASLIVHAALIGSPGVGGSPAGYAVQTFPARLDAYLLAPKQTQITPPDLAEASVLEDIPPEPEAQPAPAAPTARLALVSRPAAPPVVRAPATGGKPSEHRVYPREAVAQGLEGEVRLLLTLDGAGKILEARIAKSSGHAILDQAAVRAAYAMEPLAGGSTGTLVLPVVFRLE